MSKHAVLNLNADTGAKGKICLFVFLLGIILTFGVLTGPVFAQDGSPINTIANPYGTTINLFDYTVYNNNNASVTMWPGSATGINQGHSLYFVQDHWNRGVGGQLPLNWTGPDNDIPDETRDANDKLQKGQNWWNHFLSQPDHSVNPVEYRPITPEWGQGIVQNNLDCPEDTPANTTVGCYPKLAVGNQESLKYLFEPKNENLPGTELPIKEVVPDLNRLFYVDDHGYYVYNSNWEKVDLGTDADGNNIFIVTQGQPESQEDNVDGRPQFLPFGDPAGHISESIREYNNPDAFLMGMHMHVEDFSIPADGIVLNPSGKEEKMTFKFSGDDDVWVFIDGVLVGDLGGIHLEEDLLIDFQSGKVTVSCHDDPEKKWCGEPVQTTIREQFIAAGKYTPETWAATYGNSDTLTSGWHDLDFFYLERGSSVSNLVIDYNLINTYDFNARKFLYKQDDDDTTLARNQFHFKLTGYGAQEVDEHGADHFYPAIMPHHRPDSAIDWEPNYLDADGQYISGTDPQTLIVGNSDDGNASFGTAQADAPVGLQFRYVLEELPPDEPAPGAVPIENTNNYYWNGKIVEPNDDGSYTFGSIRYNLKKYYFLAYKGTDGWLHEQFCRDELCTDVIEEGDPEEPRFMRFDNYYGASGYFTLKGTKIVHDGDGNTDEERTFTYSLYLRGDVPSAEGTVPRARGSVTLHDGGTQATAIDFGDGGYLTLYDLKVLKEQEKATLADDGVTWTIQYTLYEDDPTSREIKPNGQKFNITVTAVDDGEGHLICTTAYDDEPVAFVNDERENDDLTIKVTKQLLGRNIKEGDRWHFAITTNNNGPLPTPAEGYILTDDGQSSFDFETITFTPAHLGECRMETSGYVCDSETYTYLVEEVGIVDGVTLDSDNPKAFSVRVSLDEETGNVKAEAFGFDEDTLDDHLTFKNRYNAQGSVTVNGTKVSVDADGEREGRDITFYLKDASGNTLSTKDITVHDSPADAPVPRDVLFDTISYSLDTQGKLLVGNSTTGIDQTGIDEQNHRYWDLMYTVTEQISNDPGLEPNYQGFRVNVRVTDDGKGTLTPEKSMCEYDTRTPNGDCDPVGEPAVFAFRNAELENKPVTLTGTKLLEGRQLTENDKWYFTIVRAPGADNANAPLPENTTVNNNVGTFSFGPITYTPQDIGEKYEYIVTESGYVPNVSNAQGQLHYFVEVFLNETGKLDAKVTRDPQATVFVNHYYEPGSTVLAAEKVMDPPWPSGTPAFNFTLTGVNSIAQQLIGEMNHDPENISLSAQATQINPLARFTAFTFDVDDYNRQQAQQAGQQYYQFTLKEEKPDCDSAGVTCREEDGITYINGVAYDTKDPIQVYITLEKVQNEDDNESKIVSHVYTGSISDDNEIRLANEIYKVGSFENIYKATPADITLGGRKHVHDVDGDRTETRKFEFSLTYADEDKTKAAENAHLTVKDEELIEGQYPNFTFPKITYYRESSEDLEDLGIEADFENVSLPYLVANDLAEFSTDANGKAVWTIRYLLTETITDVPTALAMRPNTQEFEIIVTVTGDGVGGLSAVAEPAESLLLFDNYERDDAKVHVEGEKYLNGRTLKMPDDQWTFILQGLPAQGETEFNGPWVNINDPTVTWAECPPGTPDGAVCVKNVYRTFTFGDLIVTPQHLPTGTATEKVYTYTVTETDTLPNISNTTQLTQTFTVTVTTDTAGNVVATSNPVNLKAFLRYRNYYYEPNTIVLAARKIMDPWPQIDPALKFGFTLTGINGPAIEKIGQTSLTAEATQSNPTARFAEMRFTLTDYNRLQQIEDANERYYQFMLGENKPQCNVDGITCDERDGITYYNGVAYDNKAPVNVYIKLEKVDNEDENTYEIVPHVYVGSTSSGNEVKEANEIYRIDDWTNRYEPSPVSIQPGAYKHLVDTDDDESEERIFTFVLSYAADGAVAQSKVLSNIKDGDTWQFAFNEITYTRSELDTLVSNNRASLKTGDGGILIWTIPYTLTEVPAADLTGLTVEEQSEMIREIIQDGKTVRFTVTVTDNGKGSLTVTSDPDLTGLVLTSDQKIGEINTEDPDLDPDILKLLFTNVEREDKELPVSGIKKLDGLDLTDEQWTFALWTKMEDAPMPDTEDPDVTYEETCTVEGAAKAVCVKNNNDPLTHIGLFDFGKIYFTPKALGQYGGARTYKYYVQEIDGSGPSHMINDESVFEFTVMVAIDPQTGELVVEPDPSETALRNYLTFKNEYVAEEDVVIGVEKVINIWPAKVSQFTFELTETDTYGKISGGKLTAAATTSNRQPTFDKLVFTNEDFAFLMAQPLDKQFYSFHLKEVVPTTPAPDAEDRINGVIYSDKEYDIKITLTQNENLDIIPHVFVGDVEQSKDGNVFRFGPFNNIYDLKDVSVPLGGYKEVFNEDDINKERTFTFNMCYAKIDKDRVSTGTITIHDEDGKSEITFDPANLVFTRDTNLEDSDTRYSLDALSESGYATPSTLSTGELVWTIPYTVTEVGPLDPDMMGNSQVFPVTITVKDDGTGKLTAEITPDAAEVFFKNIERHNVSIPVSGEKWLEGRTLTRDDQWTFILQGVPAQGETEFSGPLPPQDLDVTCPSDMPAAAVCTQNIYRFFDFGEMTFKPDQHLGTSGDDKAKIYTYQVTEVAIKENGLSPETPAENVPLTFRIKVYIDTETDEFKAEVIEPENTDLPTYLHFTNKYEAEGEGEIKVTKDLQGRQWRTGDSFEFTITAQNGAPMPAGCPETGECSVTINDVDGTQNHTASFGKIDFTDAGPGTYTYTIKETVPENGRGVTYDTTEHTVTFYVEDDGKGNLVAIPDGTEIQTETFTNTYKPEPVTHKLYAQKDLKGREWTNDDSFIFFIEPVNNAPAPAGSPMITITNADASSQYKKAFGEITFTEPGLYYYDVTEIHNNIGGVTYEPGPKRIKVYVKDDQTQGKLVVACDPDDGTACTEETLNATFTQTFTNIYKSSGEGEIKVTKNLVGRNWQEGDTFTFMITGVPDESGDEPVNPPMPVNCPASGACTVTINDVNGAQNHTAAFGKIDFTDAGAGTYVYMVQEQRQENPDERMNYDLTPKRVEITIIDDGQGHLVAAENSQLVNTVTVTNTFGDTGTGQVRVKKNLIGRNWTNADAFSFRLTSTGSTTPMPACENKDDDGNCIVTITKADEDEDGNYIKSFGEISFTEEGTYIYTVTEFVPDDEESIPGITYDQTDHTVIIAVVKNPETGELGPVSGTLMIQTAEFTNTYAETGEGEIKVRKDFTGREWDNNDAFIFTLTPVQKEGSAVVPPMPAGGNTITITKNDKDADTGNYIKSFGTIIFTEPGEYKYTVTEFVNGIPGVTYGANNTGITRDVTFTVGSDNSGNLSVSCNLESSTAVFTNTYAASGEGEVKVTKVLSGREWKEGDTFTFTIAGVPDTSGDEPVAPPMPANCPTSGDCIVTINDVDGAQSHTATFGKINFTKAGEYKYTVTETIGSITGITYDVDQTTGEPVEHEITIKVKDDGKGNLVADGTELIRTIEITNVYKPKPTEGEISVKKTMSGRDWQEGDSFTFTLAAENGAPMPESCAAQAACTVTIGYVEGATEHTASFGKIPFTAAGTYIYTVTESGGNIAGVTYDTTPHYVTIKVRDNAGQLVADGTNLNQTVEITNTYEAKGEGEIKVTKNLANRVWKNDDVFIFTITAQDGTPMPAGGDTVIVRSTSADHTETFGKITFTKAGTYTYTVTEVNNGISGVTYADPLTRTVTIKVKDNNDGTLVADGTELIQTLTFTNTYSAQGEGEVKVTKILSGRDWKDDDTFTFTIAKPDGAENDYPMPSTSSITIGYGDTSKTKSFGKITFTKAGEYKYTVTETKGSITGITYDVDQTGEPVKHEITIKVKDNDDGALVADGTELIRTVEITNVYKPEPATGEIKVEKILSGRDWLNGDTFTFTIAKPQGAAEDYPMPANSTVTITNGTANHTASFGTINFKEAGTYVYTVTETRGSIAGVTYDETPHTVTITVTDVNGSLTADQTVLNQTVKITNPYNATRTVEIKAKKELSGGTWPEGGSIAFVLTAQDGTPMPAGAKGNTVTLTAAGTESFAPITYELKDAGKEYTYTVTEYFSEEFGSGWTAAANPVTVKVTVGADTGTGRLDVTCDPTDFTAAFTNTYKPAPADGEILVEKVLKGREWKTGDTFTFTITAADGVPMPSNQSITITNTDEVKTRSFGTITFTKAGEYTYTVTESGTPAIGGITYDTAAKTVRINVEDKNGTLVAAEGSSLIQTVEITNTYTPAPVDGQIKVTKTLDGRDWKEGDSFTFTLAGLNNAPMPSSASITISNSDEVKTKSFGPIRFTEAGTYFYTVTETRGDITGIIYDESVHIVTLTVTDDGSGQLAAETPAVEITNSYAKPVNGQIIVTKNLSGRDWKDGDSFTFNLEGLNNAPMPSKTTVTITDGTADHFAFFGPITFEKEGTYVYQVTEEKGSLTGITYDESVHTVVFIVEKNSSGELDAAAGTTMTPKVIITNTYIVTPVCVQFGGCKSFPNAPEDVQSTEFTYKLSQNGRVIDTATTRGAGAYQFAPFIYSEPGTYSYSVEEEQGNVYGVEYDKHKYEVQVTVERDDSSGKLTATITDQDGNPVTNSNGMNFNNPYTPAARAYIQVEKTLKGGEWPEGASVTFKLEALDGAPLPAKNTVTITRPGTAAFDAITYGIESAGKVYQYTVTEFAENFGGGWSVSPVSVPVTVSITRAEDKTLHTEVTYEQGNTVTNIYNNASIQFHGQKAIKGRRTVPSNMFQFLLEGSDGTHQVVGNDGDVFTFDPVWFTAPGDYTYTITEVQGTDRRVTYDTSSYTINVSVKTDENGDPYVDSVSGDNPERIRFINDMDTTPPTPPRGGNTPPDFPDLLPATGFSAMHVTNLPEKPMDLNYKPLRMMLEIPSLGVSADIVSVPEVDGRYPVTWLGSKAGALEGYAKPGEGRAILAGHNHLNDMEAGPFAMLLDLNKGDRVFLNDGSGLQIYTVYANEKIGANDQERLDQISAQFENSITMITCEDERPEGGYANRRIVAARPL